MKAQLRAHIASVFLLLPVAATLSALPGSALAQPASPEVDSLQVAADAGLEPGSRLTFTLTGTPRGVATLRIRGVKERIALRETARGVYSARYTVKRVDRLDDGAEIRAMLRSGKRTSAVNFTFAETMARPPMAQPAPVVVPVPPPPVAQLRIDRFTVGALERIEPGAELRFTVEGIPGGTVVIDLPGIANDIVLRETRPGHYEGGYTIRRADNFNPAQPIVARLRIGDRVVAANLAQPLIVPAPDNRPPMIGNMSPREGEIVPAGPVTAISASFDDRGGSGVDPASVRILVSGRNVTPDAQINPRSFTYRAPLQPGRHTVDVTARDVAGNTVRMTWGFDVAVAAPANVPLQILSHGNNAPVDGGSTTVVGRTAPLADLNIKVDAFAPVGGSFNVSQQLYFQNIRADANGNFSFSFSPRIPLQGTRYDVTIVASRGNINNEARMSLFQR